MVRAAKKVIRDRRSAEGMTGIKSAILAALAEDRPMTIRQLFYRLVSVKAIDKTEKEYKNTVVRLLSVMRRSGEVPFSWIADNTRWQRGARTFGSLEIALDSTERAYRRSIWNDQDVYVEVWCEKDALSAVIGEVTNRWTVPLQVSRGYSSISYLHAVAQTIRAKRKPAILYYFGDHDPSGVDISRAVEAGIREFAPGVDVTFKRVAVNEDQIVSMNLPTRPTKPGDSRSRKFNGESVDVDAIPPKVLKNMVDDCITRHLDRGRYERLLQVEAAERETVKKIATAIRNGYDFIDLSDDPVGADWPE